MMLLNLINDLLDLAKQEKMTFNLDQKYFDLQAAIQHSFKTLDFLARKKGVRCRLLIDSSHKQYFKEIYGDGNRYEQILINFISNAIKFSK